MHLSQATHYHDFVYEKALQHPGPEDATITWVLDRDRQTGSKARELFADGWPCGEAIRKCFEVHCTVLWNLENVSVARRQQGLNDEGKADGGDDYLPPPPRRGRNRGHKKTFAQRQQQQQRSQQQQRPQQQHQKGGKAGTPWRAGGAKGGPQRAQQPWSGAGAKR